MITKIRRTWQETQQTKAFVKLVVLFIILGILMLASSQALGLLTQSMLQRQHTIILPAAIAFIFLEIGVLTINYIKDRYQTRTIQLMKRRFKKKTVSSLIKAPYKFSQTQERGDILGRLNDDVNSTINATNMVAYMVKSAILLFILSLGLILMDYRLFVLFLVPMLILTIVQLMSSKLTMNLVMPWKVAMGETNALAQDIINNRGTVRIFQIYKQISTWLQESLGKSRNTGIKGIFTLYLMQVPLILLVSLPMLNVLIGGTYLVSKGSLSLASLVSALTIAQLAIDEFNPIINGLMNVPHQLTSADRIFPIWDAGKETFGSNLGTTTPLIQLNNMSFSYDGETKVLDDVNMTIESGQFVAFVGESGSGKSTLLNIIDGLYVPTNGTVQVKGLSIQKWVKEEFRKLFAVVSQNTYLLDDTVRNNLSLGGSYEDEVLIKVLNDVSLHKSLDLNIGEKGTLLSGGERQRLSIARALLRQRDILLFDEATSALDIETEHVIDDYLVSQSANQTRIIVAHRLSSVIHCDKIFAFKKGQIVEEGSHVELMDLKGYYYDLVVQQHGKGVQV